MPATPAAFHEQLRHSVQVLDGFVGDAQILKKESSQFAKSVERLANEHIKQCRRMNTSAHTGNAQRDPLQDLRHAAPKVYDLANNLECCMSAISKTYKRNLKLADQGKSTRDIGQHNDTPTLAWHVHLVEDALSVVIPTPWKYGVSHTYPNPLGDKPSLTQIYRDTMPLVKNTASVATQNQCESQMVNMTAAANRLLGQLQSPKLRARVPAPR